MAETPSYPGSDAQGSADPQQGVSPEASASQSAPEASASQSAPEAITAESLQEVSQAASEPPLPSSTPEPEASTTTATSSSPAEAQTADAAEPVETSAPPEPAAVTPPEPVAAPAAPEPVNAPPAGVATSLSVPPLEEGDGNGGEWELLVGRVQAWFGSGEPQRQWQRIRGPLKGIGILVAVILALRLYATAVSTIDSIPVVSGLLELAGLIACLQFVLTRLVRSSDRREVIGQWRQRWQSFRGRG